MATEQTSGVAAPEPSALMKAAAEVLGAEDAAAGGADDAGDGAGAGADGDTGDAGTKAAAEKKAALEKKPEDAAAKLAAEEREEAEVAAADPKAKRSMDIVARKTKREMDAVTAARAKLESEKKVAEPHLAVLRELGDAAPKVLATAKAMHSAGNDPLLILRAAGVTDMAGAAKRIVAASMGDAAPADIKAALAREEAEARASKLENEIKALRDERAKEKADAERVAVLGGYKSTLAEQVKMIKAEDFPVLKAYEADGKLGEHLDGLLKLQEEHFNTTGATLPFDDLLPLYEESLQEETTPSFVAWAKERATKAKPTAADKAKAAPKKLPTNADDEQAAQTLTEKDAAASTRPRKAAATDEELEAEAVAKLQQRRAAREQDRAARRASR